MKKIFYLAGGMIVVTLVALTCLGQSRRPITPADILRLATVTDAQISPSGEWVVYTVSTIDGDSTRSALWLARATVDIVSPTGKSTPTSRDRDWPEVRRPGNHLLSQVRSASTPRWSPDGTQIAFFSNHDGQSGIWVVSIAKPDPRFVAAVRNTNFFITYAGESFAWSPDSRRIAYISATEERPQTEGSAKPGDPQVIDRVQYKSRTGFSDNRITHLWIVEVDKPEPRQLTSGPFYDHAITFNPNGDEVAFLSNHEPDPDANNNSDIFAVDLHGQVRQITSTKGCEYEPAWSPDGKWIAYTATKRDTTTIDSIAEDAHVWVISGTSGRGNELAVALDRRARSPRWSADSRKIMFLAGDRGTTTLFRIGVGGGSIERLTLSFVEGQVIGIFETGNSRFRPGIGLPIGVIRPFQIGNFSVGTRRVSAVEGPNPGNIALYTPIAITITDALHPAEVWVGLGNEVLRRVSAQNDDFVRSHRLVEPEEVNFKSFDGTPVQGWLMKPAGFREDRKHPLILSVHGGPHGMSGWGFNVTFQAYAARGYAVLYLNPRGSSGYGQNFSDGTLGEWGGGDYKDLMAGIDEVLRRHSWIGSDRLGVTGGSYGGFMTNWMITQTPRFKAAVASASVSNLISFYATSLYQDLIHAEFGGFPWDNYELLWQWSPIRYVKQAQTPTLFIHGELDNDVHITQAEEMYMALKRRGVESVLIRYPREGHGLREPKHRVDALERTLAWFDRYLK